MFRANKEASKDGEDSKVVSKDGEDNSREDKDGEDNKVVSKVGVTQEVNSLLDGASREVKALVSKADGDLKP